MTREDRIAAAREKVGNENPTVKDLFAALAESIAQRKADTERRRPLVSSAACPSCGVVCGHDDTCQIGGGQK